MKRILDCPNKKLNEVYRFDLIVKLNSDLMNTFLEEESNNYLLCHQSYPLMEIKLHEYTTIVLFLYI